MAKGKMKANTSTPVEQDNSREELRAANLQIRETKKLYKSELAAITAKYKRDLSQVGAAAYAKALADIQRETTKRDSEKTKLMRETAANFDKSFVSKFSTETAFQTKPVKKARKPKKATAAKKEAKAQ